MSLYLNAPSDIFFRSERLSASFLSADKQAQDAFALQMAKGQKVIP